MSHPAPYVGHDFLLGDQLQGGNQRATDLPRNNANPLDVPAPASGNPIAGARLYVAPDSPSAQAAQRYAGSNPQWSSLLHVIADEES